MLIGLTAKNGILIVEFAADQRRNGATILEAAMEASRVRLRPILMTALAFIIGLIPLVDRDRCRSELPPLARNNCGWWTRCRDRPDHLCSNFLLHNSAHA